MDKLASQALHRQSWSVGLLALLPVDELTRVREEFIAKYLPKAGEDEAE